MFSYSTRSSFVAFGHNTTVKKLFDLQSSVSESCVRKSNIMQEIVSKRAKLAEKVAKNSKNRLK